MGFALYTKSGTFNPVTFGLSPGDQIYVVVVGGGGGGGLGYNATESAPGGSGGTSSFGSYLTALGGSGGVSYNATQGTQGRFLGGCYSSMGGGGAGGWLPGYEVFGGDAPSSLEVYSSALDSMGHINLPEFAGYCGSRGFPAFYLFAGDFSTARYPAGFVIHTHGPQRAAKWNAMAIANSTSSVSAPQSESTYLTMSSRNNGTKNLAHFVSGGNSSVGVQSRYNYLSSFYQNIGGVGYGAGGAGGSYYYYYTSSNYSSAMSYGGYGGNSGEIKMQMIQLTSTSSITVTIGGGGSGGAGSYHSYSTTTYNSFTPGKNGTAGAPGAATSSVSGGNAGGYGDNPSGGTALCTTIGSASNGTEACALNNAAGGGASGCVAIYW